VKQRLLSLVSFTHRERIALWLLVGALGIGGALSAWQRVGSESRLQEFEVGYAPMDARIAASAAAALTATDDSLRVDINTADAETLDLLPRIGPVLAGRIIEYRETHGVFRRVEEIMDVKGIGEKTLERLRPYIFVSDAKVQH
jgi:comEA protein